MYTVRLICKVIQGSLTDQRYVDEVLHPHVLQIYQTVRNISLFQQDNISIPAILQGTVCKLTMLYPIDWPFRAQSISDLPPLGSSKLADALLYLNPSVKFPKFEHKIIEQCQCIPRGVGYNLRIILSMRKSLTECIHKGGGQTKYDLQYIIQACSCLKLFSIKPENWVAFFFISMSIFNYS